MGGTAGRGGLPSLDVSKSTDDSSIRECSLLPSPSIKQMAEKSNSSLPRSVNRDVRRMPRITVVVRKRPLTQQEWKRSDVDAVKMDTQDTSSVIVEELRSRVDTTKYIEKHEFRVDRAFDETSQNSAIYSSCVKPLIISAMEESARCSCFAYGQTGSGKTYTMLGPTPYDTANEPGIFELAVRDIFNCLERQITRNRRFAFVSFYEIYCGKLYDLLQKRKLVAALENGKKEVIVKDLKVERVDSKEILLKKMIEGVELRK
ncbi:internal kinesin motor domain protein, partial [Cardiosporidium cionae]